MINLLKATFRGFKDDKASRMGAETAYYAIFSLAPLLLVAISLAGLFLSRDQIEGTLYTQLEGLVGADGVGVVRSMVEAAADRQSGIFGMIAGVALLILGATGIMVALQTSFNNLWHVELIPQKTGIVTTIGKRLLSFGLVLSIGFLLVISMLASSVIYALSEQLSGWLSLPEPLIYAVTIAVNLSMLAVFFSLMIKYLPDVIMPWKAAFVGGLFTTLLFFAGKYLIAFYLGRQAEASPYGVATALILLLLWVNYSAQILFLGVEFTKAWLKQYRLKVVPKPYACFERRYRFVLIPPVAVSFFHKMMIMAKFVSFEIWAARKAVALKQRMKRKPTTQKEQKPYRSRGRRLHLRMG